MVELAHRRTPTLDVTLSWGKQEDRLEVRVHDLESDEVVAFEPERSRALLAFYAPFAYRALTV